VEVEAEDIPRVSFFLFLFLDSFNKAPIEIDGTFDHR
jgi:hypothetical protein